HLHRVRRGHPVGGGRAGQVRVHAEHDLGLRHAALGLGHGDAGQRHRRQRQRGCQRLSHRSLLSSYMPSMTSLYLRLTNVRFSFIVGVSSSSSAVSSSSMSRNFLIVSTRANCLLTRSISPQMRSWTSRARHSEAKLVKGTLRSCANCATVSWSIMTRHE